METNKFDNFDQQPASVDPGYADARAMDKEGALRAFMANVFSLMFAGLGVTAIISYIVGTNETLLGYFNQIIMTEYGPVTGGPTILGWIVMFAPLGMLFLMRAGVRKWSPQIVLALYFVFTALFGLSLAYIFSRFTMGSILSTFLVTSLTFGVMAVVGYTTKTDLTKLGGILMMAVIGLVIAMVVNFFMQSETIHYVISGIGVLIFTGLTAYDVQKLKRIGSGTEYGSASAAKLAIWGAVDLYLDFLNLFMFLLQFLGNRD